MRWKRKDKSAWHSWFSWFPVRLADTGELVWLERVGRRHTNQLFEIPTERSLREPPCSSISIGYFWQYATEEAVERIELMTPCLCGHTREKHLGPPVNSGPAAGVRWHRRCHCGCFNFHEERIVEVVE